MIPVQIEYALDELGVEEWPGDRSNPEVEKYIAATPRGRWSYTDAVSWCGGFMAWTSLESGLAVPENGHRARAWLRAGERTSEPFLGCGAVLRLRKGKRGRRARSQTGSARGGRHVGWYLNHSRGAPVLLSGNISDRVGIDIYPTRTWEVERYFIPDCPP